MSAIQNFAEQVAGDVGAIQDPSVKKAVDWTMIVELISQILLSIVGNCPNNEEQIKRSAKDPSLMQRVWLRKQVKEHCDCCGNFGRWRNDVSHISDAIVVRAAAATPADLDAMLREARHFDNMPF